MVRRISGGKNVKTNRHLTNLVKTLYANVVNLRVTSCTKRHDSVAYHKKTRSLTVHVGRLYCRILVDYSSVYWWFFSKTIKYYLFFVVKNLFDMSKHRTESSATYYSVYVIVKISLINCYCTIGWQRVDQNFDVVRITLIVAALKKRFTRLVIAYVLGRTI